MPLATGLHSPRPWREKRESHESVGNHQVQQGSPRRNAQQQLYTRLATRQRGYHQSLKSIISPCTGWHSAGSRKVAKCGVPIGWRRLVQGVASYEGSVMGQFLYTAILGGM